MAIRLSLATAAALALFAAPAHAENKLAPIPKADATSTHGPFEQGACETCHQRNDPSNPGAAMKVSNDLCFECHDEFKGSAQVRMERRVHPKGSAICVGCHNPHNSKKRKLQL